MQISYFNWRTNYFWKINSIPKDFNLLTYFLSAFALYTHAVPSGILPWIIFIFKGWKFPSVSTDTANIFWNGRFSANGFRAILAQFPRSWWYWSVFTAEVEPKTIYDSVLFWISIAFRMSVFPSLSIADPESRENTEVVRNSNLISKQSRLTIVLGFFLWLKLILKLYTSVPSWIFPWTIFRLDRKLSRDHLNLHVFG